MIKLIIADCDGTILNKESKLDGSLCKLIKKLEKKNIQFSIATGRNQYLATTVVDQLDLNIPYVVNNGAIIMEQGHPLCVYGMNSDSVGAVCRLLMEYNVAFILYGMNKISQFSNHEIIAKYRPLLSKHSEVEYFNVKNITKMGELVKVTVGSDDIELVQKLADYINAKYPEILFRRSEGNLYTITSKLATKGNAVTQLAKMMDIDMKDVMCIGDNYNDLSMFEVAGVSVAMNNSEQSIKDETTHVAGDYNFEGVSQFLKQYFKVT